MNEPTSRIISLLHDVRSAAALLPEEWTTIIATARATNLLGTLAHRLHEAGVRTDCGAARHLDGARQLSVRQHSSVRWEIQCIDEALAAVKAPVVLLKGAAYVAGGHRNAQGRLFGDIDILVPSAELGTVESQLMLHGWTSGKLDPYDQRYYRQWMHELPPMFHLRRGSVIDVHHTILPRTGRHRPIPQAILERATPLPGFSVLHIPCVEDLLIHSITHLVHEGELNSGLRDLHDIDSLISCHGGKAGFWSRLVEYTVQHDLSEPVGLGLDLARTYLRTRIPDEVLHALTRGKNSPPRFWRQRLIDYFGLAISHWPDGAMPLQARIAVSVLYVRAHALRMPPSLLIPHLVRKALMRFSEPIPQTADQ